jgi:hypothetical protein
MDTVLVSGQDNAGTTYKGRIKQGQNDVGTINIWDDSSLNAIKNELILEKEKTSSALT